jgi:hypothetical protein
MSFGIDAVGGEAFSDGIPLISGMNTVTIRMMYSESEFRDLSMQVFRDLTNSTATTITDKVSEMVSSTTTSAQLIQFTPAPAASLNFSVGTTSYTVNYPLAISALIPSVTFSGVGVRASVSANGGAFKLVNPSGAGFPFTLNVGSNLIVVRFDTFSGDTIQYTDYDFTINRGP